MPVGFRPGGLLNAGVSSPFGPTTPPMPTGQDAITNQYKLYNTGVQQNAEDYGGIMAGYRNILNNPLGPNPQQPSRGYTPQQFTPERMSAPSPTQIETQTYQPSADVTGSLSQLSELSKTGGYDEAGKADLRSRGIAPIRAVYANAQRNVDRSRSLQGGYSPSYNAVTAKMAREQASQISDAEQNVNAGIAQNVASNRLSAAPAWAAAAGQQSALINNIGRSNADATNQGRLADVANRMRVNEFNAGGANRANEFNVNNVNEANRFNAQLPVQDRQFQNQNVQNQLEALRGMNSLYGTTPAMSRLFGDQAMQGQQFQNQVTQQNRDRTMRPLYG